MKIAKFIQSLTMEARSFSSGAYPDFVTSAWPKPLDISHVPVFMFHTVEKESFERQLQHLVRNGYRTIDTDGMYDFLTGKSTLSGPSVMLTFDDGERSLYDVAYPLLKKYGLKAVNFIVTGRVYERDDQRPATGKQWLTWTEVSEMHNEGVIDFQSHTHLHETMFADDQLLDFMRPGLFTDELLVDRPLVRTNAGDKLLLESGAPIYAMTPRMMDRPKFYDRADIRDACINWVRDHGGDDYFQHPGWRNELTGIWQKARGMPPAGTMESIDDHRAAILDSLVRSKEMLANCLQKTVHHLAYPWASGGKLSVELSKQAGYLSNYWGPLPRQPVNEPGHDPFYIARIKDDYLLRLPGEGRSSLLDIMTMKLRRRTAKDDIY